jgi:sec-independent protein translocase protein TatC
MLNHLLELRQRALIVLGVFAGMFVLCYCFSAELFHILFQPVLQVLRPQESLIATRLTSPVLTPLSVAGDFAMMGTAPVALFHFWHFIAPGLYPHERQKLSTVIIPSLLLFCLGMIFCFFIMLPLMFQFFTKATPAEVRMMPDIAVTLGFITQMLILSGFCFQVPLVCLMLVKLRWVSVSLLKTIRPYVIVAAFILGMLLTPPDVLSQILLAVPLCLLYEIGIRLANRFK